MGRMFSLKLCDKRVFSRCGRALLLTTSALDRTLLSPSFSLSNFRNWPDNTTASHPLSEISKGPPYHRREDV
ncbi:hypothetical protein P5673_010034 [Acropora cervicornis]|uniref:Uncharacterized protein n=1 Tax=Acropora cervicornis TaxID=6130 RepID=A0AAD9V910_ACRCE|nr:hypothetical protein P5673_010034 [Acropora cervicornis]